MPGRSLRYTSSRCAGRRRCRRAVHEANACWDAPAPPASTATSASNRKPREYLDAVTTSAERTIPFPFRSRVGTVHDGQALWGYVYVRQDAIATSRLFSTTREECLREEMFRVLPPAPD